MIYLEHNVLYLNTKKERTFFFIRLATFPFSSGFIHATHYGHSRNIESSWSYVNYERWTDRTSKMKIFCRTLTAILFYPERARVVSVRKREEGRKRGAGDSTFRVSYQFEHCMCRVAIGTMANFLRDMTVERYFSVLVATRFFINILHVWCVRLVWLWYACGLRRL